MSDSLALQRTPLHPLQVRLGAKMVPFAGYEMPLHYSGGIIAEHLHTRAQAGLFDVSHMGQVRLSGPAADRALETLVPSNILGLPLLRMRYTLLLNDQGGILDDLIVTSREKGLFLVVNAARKEADLAIVRDRIGDDVQVEFLAGRALLALQGPSAAAILSRFLPGIDGLSFMTAAEATFDGHPCFVTRSGYTGEDGFEISLAAADAEAVAERLLAEPEVLPIGLGARDTLRLEAGLCLYGHDIDEGTTPVAADLAWTIGKRRRADGDFPGAATILRELAEGAPQRRVGIRPEGRAPAREGTPIVDSSGAAIGRVTSGGFGPSVGGPIAMGYVERDHAAPGNEIGLLVRGTIRPARIVPLPFVAPRYHRPPAR